MVDDAAELQKGRPRLMGFFANPVVGIAGSLASLFGVLLAVYFFIQSRRYRELVYYVNPARTVVVKTGEASRLRVLLGDRELRSDVTAAQIAIWNQGNEPIRSTNVLAPFTIRTNPPTRLLEARIRRKSREVVDISLDQTHLQDGVLAVSWNILEQGDGGVIQLVYEGQPGTQITASGVIEGQREIRQLQYSGKIRSPSEQVRLGRKFDYILWAYVAFGIAMAVTGMLLDRPKKGRALTRIMMWIVMPSLLLGASIYMLLTSQAPEPPFGF
jgi:hypothetical protein